MKKIYQIVILLVSLLYINSSSDCNGIENPSRSECHDLSSADNGEYCCFYKYNYKGTTYTTCLLLDKSEKDNINKCIDTIETEDDVSIKSLDCKSSFIELGLFGLIFLLL